MVALRVRPPPGRHGRFRSGADRHPPCPYIQRTSCRSSRPRGRPCCLEGRRPQGAPRQRPGCTGRAPAQNQAVECHMGPAVEAHLGPRTEGPLLWRPPEVPPRNAGRFGGGTGRPHHVPPCRRPRFLPRGVREAPVGVPRRGPMPEPLRHPKVPADGPAFWSGSPRHHPSWNPPPDRGPRSSGSPPQQAGDSPYCNVRPGARISLESLRFRCDLDPRASSVEPLRPETTGRSDVTSHLI